MTPTEKTHRFRDLANAAGVLLQAVQQAPDRGREHVEGIYADATVTATPNGVDVELHGDGATVHIRRDG